MTALPPGATIGILGGGQLGRMTALAAARLGYRCHVFCPEKDAPASAVAAATTCAPYENAGAQARFAAAVDVITYEFENIPLAPVEALAALKPVRPAPAALAVCQDRIREKSALRDAGIGTAAFRPVRAIADLDGAVFPAILKTARLGYDGKGQALVAGRAEAEAAFARFRAVPCVLEEVVDFACEISVIAARDEAGRIECYVPVENRHRDHILDETIAPARIAPALAADAKAVARRIAESLGIVGLIAVEMFATSDGRVLVNELAPRPHNSGHWTIDACATSQFEQLVRAICGLPLGSPERHSDAHMKNLIGDEAGSWATLLADAAVRLHLYGKAEPRPGRKMGHATRLFPRGDAR